MTNERQDPIYGGAYGAGSTEGSDTTKSTTGYPLGETGPATGGTPSFDDTTSTSVSGDRLDDEIAVGFDSDDTGHPARATTGDAGPAGGVSEKVGEAKDVVVEKAEQAKDTALQAKDTALERGGDVVATAKDEVARLADEARTQVQGLWSQASGQLREQAQTGQHQLADLLHSIAGELGEMASKSEQDGPVTALARQAAAKSGEWSHWLSNSEPADLLTEVRRFARRRPFVFLASAAVAGALVGRLTRGLMAGDNTPSVATSQPARSLPATSTIVGEPAPISDELDPRGPDFSTTPLGGDPVREPADLPDGRW